MLNPGSERSIISICLKDPTNLLKCEELGLEPHHFSIEANAYIYMAIAYLFNRQVGVTPVALNEVIVEETMRKAVDELGGLQYIMTLSMAKDDERSLSIFVDKVIQSKTRQEIYGIGERLQKKMLDKTSEVLNPNELAEVVSEELATLQKEIDVKEDVYKMGSDTEEIMKLRAEKPNSIPGLATGFTQFDRITGGAKAGDLIILMARSKVGKSVWLLNVAIKLAIKDKLPILYIDSEMDARNQEDRMLANLTGLPYSEITSGLYMIDTDNGKASDKRELIKSAIELIKSGNFYHIQMPTFEISAIKSITRQYKMKYNICALIFDYIKLPSSGNNARVVQEYQALGFLTSGIKELASELKIPVFTAGQENRSDTGGSKSEANIAGSDRILHMATTLVFLYNKDPKTVREENMMNGNQELLIKFQRNGASDCEPINIMFNKPILRMEEV